MQNLTENEIKVLKTIIKNEYEEHEYNDEACINWGVWFFVCENSGIKGKALSGVTSSLVKKGCVYIEDEEGNDSTIAVTEIGFNSLQKYL